MENQRLKMHFAELNKIIEALKEEKMELETQLAQKVKSNLNKEK